MTIQTAFMWGYWGWGNHTEDLVKVVDAIERRRGWKPPYFVDIRYHRSAKAVGFRGGAFAELVGPRRYRWMKSLGNQNIGTEGRISIAEPGAANDLLDLVTEKRREGRRVIYFCACEDPCYCHRMKVSKLLVKAASKRAVRLAVEEWPGGKPRVMRIKASAETVKKTAAGTSRVPLFALPKNRRDELLAMPWGSRIELRDRQDGAVFLAAPARYEGTWHVPVLSWGWTGRAVSSEPLKRETTRLRKRWGYEPLKS